MWPLLHVGFLQVSVLQASFAGLGLAGPSLGAPRPSGGDDATRQETPAASWRELDSAIASLDEPRAEGFSWGLLLRTFYTQSPKEGGAGTNDLSGQVLEDVDAWFATDVGELSWRLSAELDEGTTELEDAHARWHAYDWLGLMAGQFKPRVVRSGSMPDDGLLLRERTFLGAAFDAWDDGVELGGHYDQFDYWFALTDGSNGQDSDHFWSARGEWALYDAAFEDREGARGSPTHLCVLLGAFLFEDVAQSTSDGGGWGADFALTFGPYAFHVEWADLDEDFARTIDVFNGYLITIGDGKPRSGTLSRRVLEDGEVAARFQAADDLDSTEAVGLGASWRQGDGPVRFLADLALVEGDTRDFSMFSVGVQAGSSGLSRPFAEPR